MPINLSSYALPAAPAQASAWKLRHWLLLLGGAIAIVIGRRIDAITNPQFWAEDGTIWYAQAHELGLHALLLAQNGYFQTVSRLTAAASQLFDLRHAPLFFNWVAIAFQVQPVALLNSERGRALIDDSRVRLAVSLLYLVLPYTHEVHVNVTNIQWHLALTGLLLIVFGDWPRWSQKIGDTLLIALCGASGPFCAFLFPVALHQAWQQRTRRATLLALILLAAVLIQGAAWLSEVGQRSVVPLGASFDLFARIFAGQVVCAGLFGDLWTFIYRSGIWQHSIWPAWVVTIAGLALLLRAFAVANSAMRCVIVFGLAVFFAAMIAPQVSADRAQWLVLSEPHAGERYSFLPMIGFYASLLWIALRDSRKSWRRVATGALICVALLAVPASLRIRPYVDMHFDDYARRFDAALEGSVIRIPINPPGWQFELTKR